MSSGRFTNSGSTDQFAFVKMWTTADGVPNTTSVYNTSGLSVKWQLDNGTVNSMASGAGTLASGAAGDAHSDGKFYHTGNSYCIAMPDAAYASAGTLRVWIELASNDSVPWEVQIGAANPNAAAFGANTIAPATVSEIADEVQTRTIARVTLVDTVTVNTDMRGTDNAALATTLGSAVGASISADIAAVKSVSDITQSNMYIRFDTVDSAQGVAQDSLDEILLDTGTTLPAQIAGISGAVLTGDYTLSITVTDVDSGLPIESARVRIYRTGADGTQSTDPDGEVSMARDAATWAVTVSADGYESLATTLVVTGDAPVSYELNALVVAAPDDPAKSAIEVLCLNEDSEAEADIDVDFRIVVIPSGDTNKTFFGGKVTKTSNASGVARYEGPRGATIEYKRGRADVWTRVVLDNDSLTSVTSIIGSP